MYKISNIQTGTEFENVAGVGTGEIDGNSYQATRSGKNLLKETTTDSGDGNYWIEYSTLDKATRTLTVTTSDTTEHFLRHKVDGIKSNTTYTLSFEAKSNGYVSSMDMFCFNADIQGIKASGGHTLTTSFQKFTWTFTTDSSVDYSTGSSIRIDNNGSTTSGTDATLTVKNVMLVEGTDTDYEEYGVSPSPDYPSEVEVINTCNLLYGEIEQGAIDGSGNNSSNTARARTKEYSEITPNTNYIASVKDKTQYLGIYFYDESKTFVSVLTWKQGDYVFTSPSNAKYVRIAYRKSDSTATVVASDIEEAQINKGNIVKPYLPYGHIGLKQTGKNIFKPSIDDFSITYTSSYQTQARNLDRDILLKANIQYTLSFECKSNSNKIFNKFLLRDSSGTDKFVFTIYKAIPTTYTKYSTQIKPTSDTIIHTFSLQNADVDTFYFKNIQLEKGSTATEHEPYKETIYDIDLNGNTLCKVGDVEDVLNIDKQGNVSILKKINKLILTGDKSWTYLLDVNLYKTLTRYTIYGIDTEYNSSIASIEAMSNIAEHCTDYSHYTSYDNQFLLRYITEQKTRIDLMSSTLGITTVADWKTWLSNNKPEMYYVLATPQTIELPYTTPIKLYEGYNNFELLTNLDTDYNITTYYKPMSNEFKNRVKSGKIVKAYMKFPATDTQEELIIDENNYLKELTLSDERYAPDEGFIGQAVAKEVTGEFYNVSTDFNIQDREFELYVGVELEDETTEYIKYGTFIVQKPENDTVSDNTSFTALDYMVKFNQTYIDRVTYPCTLRTLFEDICDQAGVDYDVPSFLNEDFILEDNQLELGTTLREALKGIAQIAFNWARINEDDMVVMDFDKDIDVSETIDSNQYFDLTTQNQYGELNTIVLRNSQVEGENYTIVDKDRVAKDGTIELTISDNPFAYTQEKRQQLIQVGEGLFGLKYIPLTASTIGLFYLNCNDKIKVTDTANKEYETYVLNHSFTYNGVISEETIEADAQTLTETQYQFTTELERVYQHTELIVDKAKQEISATIENDTVSKSEYSEFKQTLEGWEATVSLKEDVTNQINILKQDISGITNTLESSGGNNIFYYSTDFWALPDGGTTLCLEETTSTDISQNSLSGMGYILNKGTSEQKQSVKNGDYVINFSLKKTNSLSNQYIYINNTKYTITPNSLNAWEEFEYTISITTTSIDIKIESDTDNSAYITDFMAAPGTEAQTWTQNPNETFTDTVTIGKGITVKSSASNTYTTINNDGNRTFNSDTGERVAEMTDKGVYTKELEVEGQAKIGDLLIQTIDNQVWISGIGG